MNIIGYQDIDLNVMIERFQGAHPIVSNKFSLEDEETLLEFEQSVWKISTHIKIADGIVDLKIKFKIVKGDLEYSSVSLSFDISNWSINNYLLMPSAVYNGNRFESRKMDYPPQFSDECDINAYIPTIITDVPRLNISSGSSRIQLLAGDMSTPAIGWYEPASKKGIWILTEQMTAWGSYGISIEENDDRSKAVVTVSNPGVRYDNRYTICNMLHPSEDQGACFKEGDAVELNVRLYSFDCPKVQGLFDYFAEIRKDLIDNGKLQNSIPFSHAWKIQEAKYNKQNWEELYGYYSAGMRENIYQDWQIGWCGGIMVTYALLSDGMMESRKRAIRNLDFVFNGGQDTSGFFHGCWHEGKWYGDNFHYPEKKWHLIRKSSDALYFIIKQLNLLEMQGEEFAVPEKWLVGTRKCADAFVKLWKKYGQFGQFVDTESGEIIVGGSASAAIAPAGLVLAGIYFNLPEYITVSKASALYLYENFTKKGYTTGGPGEILQCPDSESAFGLLESFIVLYEATGEEQWLQMARDQANQCFSWCVSYDFRFPYGSSFGKLGISTIGSVYANVQNKHSAPGICTLSGDSLFKLFRATGDRKYMKLLQEIAHNLPQYLSREDRPILAWNNNIGVGDGSWKEMPSGWMSERVNMSDWLEPVGEIFYGSCWCEVSNMLTFAEVPGLYLQPDTGFICAIDHIEAEIIGVNDEAIQIHIKNPTCYKADVKVFIETESEMKKALGQNWTRRCMTISIEPDGQITKRFMLSGASV